MEQPNKVLITGATGMLGSHMVGEMLRESSATLVLAVRNAVRIDRLWQSLARQGFTAPQKQYNDRIEVVECSLADPLRLSEVMAGVETIYHCAAAVSLGDGDNIVANNVEITSAMTDAALKSGVRLFVHVSSIATLGASTLTRPLIDENTDLGSINEHSAYSVSKFLSENRVRRAAELGLRTVVVNPAIILGEGDWYGSGSSAIIPTLTKGFPAAPRGVTGYVDVRDVARAMRMLSLCEKAVGERFVLAATSISFRELAALAARSAGRPAPLFTVGRTAVELLRTVTGIYAFVTRTENRLSRSIARNLLAKNYYDGSKVTRFTEFRYTPVAQTVSRIVESYKQSCNR